MSICCVVTVDGTRARFFILEKSPRPAVEAGPLLVEQEEALVNPENEMAGRELWSDTRASRNTANGMAHGYDDHRAQHGDEMKRRFAKVVAEQAVQLAERKGAKTLVLAAEKQMLGFLRGALQVPPKAGFEVRELAKDLSRLSPQELQSHLAAEGLLPPRQRPAPG
mgnify:CR=1 FL=1